MTQYELGRYITASEGYWHSYNFPIQSKQPPVEMLTIHLEDEQVITFNDEGAAMTLHPEMQHVVYPDAFQHFTYILKIFQLRKKKNDFSRWLTQLDDSP